MNEVAMFRRGSVSLQVPAELSASAGGEVEDGVLDRTDKFTFKFRATNAVRDFFDSIQGINVEATRTMPGRLLDVDSASPQPDRNWMVVVATG